MPKKRSQFALNVISVLFSIQHTSCGWQTPSTSHQELCFISTWETAEVPKFCDLSQTPLFISCQLKNIFTLGMQTTQHLQREKMKWVMHRNAGLLYKITHASILRHSLLQLIVHAVLTHFPDGKHVHMCTLKWNENVMLIPAQKNITSDCISTKVKFLLFQWIAIMPYWGYWKVTLRRIHCNFNNALRFNSMLPL